MPPWYSRGGGSVRQLSPIHSLVLSCPNSSLGPSRPPFTSEAPARAGALLQSRIRILRHLGPDAPAAETRPDISWESPSQPPPAAGRGSVYSQQTKSPPRAVFLSQSSSSEANNEHRAETPHPRGDSRERQFSFRPLCGFVHSGEREPRSD